MRTGGGTVVAVHANVADEAQLMAMFAAGGRPTRPAGQRRGGRRPGRVDKLTLARLHRMLAINVVGSSSARVRRSVG